MATLVHRRHRISSSRANRKEEHGSTRKRKAASSYKKFWSKAEKGWDLGRVIGAKRRSR